MKIYKRKMKKKTKLMMNFYFFFHTKIAQQEKNLINYSACNKTTLISPSRLKKRTREGR